MSKLRQSRVALPPIIITNKNVQQNYRFTNAKTTNHYRVNQSMARPNGLSNISSVCFLTEIKKRKWLNDHKTTYSHPPRTCPEQVENNSNRYNPSMPTDNEIQTSQREKMKVKIMTTKRNSSRFLTVEPVPVTIHPCPTDKNASMNKRPTNRDDSISMYAPYHYKLDPSFTANNETNTKKSLWRLCKSRLESIKQFDVETSCKFKRGIDGKLRTTNRIKLPAIHYKPTAYNIPPTKSREDLLRQYVSPFMRYLVTPVIPAAPPTSPTPYTMTEYTE